MKRGPGGQPPWIGTFISLHGCAELNHNENNTLRKKQNKTKEKQQNLGGQAGRAHGESAPAGVNPAGRAGVARGPQSGRTRLSRGFPPLL